MAWTTPLTAVANTALTAAQWNASVRDNLNETAAAKATTAGRIFVSTGANALAERQVTGATVNTSETTTSTTYTALTTPGPAVTVTTGPAAVVAISGTCFIDTVGSRVLSSFAVSGATTVASTDNNSFGQDASGIGRVLNCSRVHFLSGLTPGSNVFTQQYRVSANTGSFVGRHISLIAL